ncbi:pyridoxal phosphate-dependent aminotransferase [Thermoproteota archaeon]
MMRLSTAADRLEGQKMFQVLAKTQELERQGRDIIHFEIGDPDFDTPKNIVDATYTSLENGETHYTASSGMFDFKVAAADVTEKSRGFRPDIEQLLVTPGANVQIYYAIACAVNPGEEVIIPDPSFVSYASIINFLGMKPIRIPLLEKNEFRMNPDDVEKAITPKTKMIIINSPNNPTGSVMTEQEMKRMYEIAEENDIYLLSDEIYTRMIYKDSETGFFSPSKYDHCRKRTIVVNGFSKSYAMTGWRLGVVTGPSDLITKMGLVLETTTSCVSPFLQRAGIEALKGSQEPINDMVKEFRKRRDIIVEGLNTLPGVKCLKPKGAFYVFPNITGTGLTSQEFTDLMLDKVGVAICPGDFFGIHGEGYVRLCYANSIDNIQKGIERMRKALESRSKNNNI